MQDKIKTLQDTETVTDEALTSLSLLTSALTVTLENLDRSAIPLVRQGNPTAAIHFVKRFPMYIDTLYLILESMEKTRDSLEIVSKGIFEVREQERG